MGESVSRASGFFKGFPFEEQLFSFFPTKEGFLGLSRASEMGKGGRSRPRLSGLTVALPGWKETLPAGGQGFPQRGRPLPTQLIGPGVST